MSNRAYSLLLAGPFVIGVLLLQGLTVELETFHGSDARSYHLPTIRLFADELPSPDLESYPAAQAPLFHLLFAVFGEIFGFELWKLQALNVLISYGAVLALFHLLSARMGISARNAFALALLFALSPYFFGASFILLTDNLAILFGLLALIGFHRFTRERSLAAFGLACLATAAALVTRQAFVWLLPVGFVLLLMSGVDVRRKAAGLGLLGAAAAPLGALFLAWDGLVPKGSDPTSCGLCPTASGNDESEVGLRAVGFTVALVGLYAAAVHGPRLLRSGRSLLPRLRPFLPVAAGLALGVALLGLSPLEYQPIEPGVGGDAGYLWKVSDRLPVVASSSLAFWALVPLGAAAAVLLSRRAGALSMPTLVLAFFLLSSLPVRLVYQKYFDPFALLAVVLLAREADLRRRWDYAGIAAAALAFVAYAASFEV